MAIIFVLYIRFKIKHGIYTEVLLNVKSLVMKKDWIIKKKYLRNNLYFLNITRISLSDH